MEQLTVAGYAVITAAVFKLTADGGKIGIFVRNASGKKQNDSKKNTQTENVQQIFSFFCHLQIPFPDAIPVFQSNSAI